MKITKQQQALKKVLTSKRFNMKYDSDMEILSNGNTTIAFYGNGWLVISHGAHIAFLLDWTFEEFGNGLYLYADGKEVELIKHVEEELPF